MTGHQMCVFIAGVVEEVTGTTRDPKEIWNMSPTGELWPVFDLYNRCRVIRLMALLKQGAPVFPLDPRTPAHDDLLYFLHYRQFPPPGSFPARMTH